MAFDGELTPEERAKVQRLKDDFEFFARNCLFIRTKTGEVKPFILNRAQQYLHAKLEKQRKETGKVRAIILKGRQLGASTYIQGRYYWRLWGGRGLQAFILTHEQPATDNMFAMAQRFHDNIPVVIKPPTKAANAKELSFSDNGCSYAVATAGTKGVGRSSTLQLFHGSEAAFWPNAETHIDGAFQALADVEGTERLLESTANSIGNVFQRRYSAAQRGDADEEAIFIPWYWGEDYERPVPSDWAAPPHWADYQRMYALTDQQLYWAFKKNADMASALGETDAKPCWKFMQEYPASAEEAFQTAGNSFIPSPAVAVARKNKIPPVGAMVIGLDPARGGGDKTGVVDRIGRVMGSKVCERWDDLDLMVCAGKAHSLLKKYPEAIMNIDVGGLGAGVYDRLVEMGMGARVNAINFGSSPLGIGPTGDELYANRRAEMWDLKRDWYMHPAGVQVPDDDIFHADETSPVWVSGATRHSSNNELTLESKDKIRERLGFSPDLGDAAALTFAVPVSYEAIQYDEPVSVRGRNNVTGY
nr:MAG: terminase large subunit [Caudoviricetes sp.]